MTIYSEAEDAKICKLYREGRGVVEIAKLLHHDSGHVSRILWANGIWIRGSRNFTDAEEAMIGRIYQSGTSAKAIARAYGLSHHTSITSALKRQGVTQRSPAERNRLYKLNPHKFDVINHEHKAYWLGFLYADGGVDREKTLKLSLKIADIEHIRKFRDFLESESPVKSIQQKCAGKYYPQARAEFTDRHLAKRLMNLGIVKGRPNFRPITAAIPPELLRHFIRGFWDGDGCAARNPNDGINFCGNEDLMIWLREYLAEKLDFGPRKVSKHTTANLYYLRYSGRRVALRVIEFMFKNATIWLPRKLEVIRNWPEPQRRHKNERGQFI